ncbi:uncharacterized protein BXZ73DRAFT_109066 [Epithele typhae]|uniref:uncharacterized protein n=1 Tax=Epithele typhae TaxID=378194 RepID=UPI002007D2FA|nr:uncharacterized protein BXZ73DRAFT_109066 [Epithele typhae]KAH9910399.1 hypothetical protein BXZ73DRAFT_109066 [Epithele typhae]
MNDVVIHTSPINTLPTETLLATLSFALSGHESRPSISIGPAEHYDALLQHMFDGKTSYINALLTLTSICRRWRGVILAYPLFWNNIQHHSPFLHELFLQRSCSTTISLHLRTSLAQQSHSTQSLVTMLPGLAQRLRHLYLEIDEGTVDPADLLNFPAPEIQCLVVSISLPRLDVDSATTAHPMALFQNNAPNLRALALHGHWGCISPTNHFPHLTHLFLVFGVEWQVHSPELLLALLSHTPALESLHLADIMEENFASDFPPAEHEYVSLRHLRTITVQMCDVDFTCALLSRLVLSEASIRAVIQANTFRGSHPIPQTIKDILRPFVPCLSLMGPTRLCMQDISEYAAILLESHDRSARGPSVVIDLYDAVRRSVDWHLALLELPRVVPSAFAALVSLRINRSEFHLPFTPALLQLLAHTPALTELCVNFGSPHQTPTSLTYASSPFLKFLAPSAHLPLPLPRLTVLALGAHCTSIEATVAFARPLKATLIARAARAARLQLLIVRPLMAAWTPPEEGAPQTPAQVLFSAQTRLLDELDLAPHADEVRVLAPAMVEGDVFGMKDWAEGEPARSRWEAAAAAGEEERERYWTFVEDDKVHCECETLL